MQAPYMQSMLQSLSANPELAQQVGPFICLPVSPSSFWGFVKVLVTSVCSCRFPGRPLVFCCMSVSLFPLLLRPDITVMVDWALKINYLSIYPLLLLLLLVLLSFFFFSFFLRACISTLSQDSFFLWCVCLLSVCLVDLELKNNALSICIYTCLRICMYRRAVFLIYLRFSLLAMCSRSYVTDLFTLPIRA